MLGDVLCRCWFVETLPFTVSASQGTQRLYATTMVGVIVAAGFGLGVALPNETEVPQPWPVISAIVGWSYFATWSISFYPQIVINYQRKRCATCVEPES